MVEAAGGRQQAAGGNRTKRGVNVNASNPLSHENEQVRRSLPGRLPPAARCLLFPVRLLPAACRLLSTWLRQRRADMVWSAVILVAVLLPLASLTIDVPRYYVLRSRLQLGADAAAQAAAGCVDTLHFQNTGETRLDFWCQRREPRQVFYATVTPLYAAEADASLYTVTVDEVADTVTITACGNTRLFFGLTPAVTIWVEARSRFRMEAR
jgi:hypothetical protein